MGFIAVQTKGYIGGDALYFVNEAKGLNFMGLVRDRLALVSPFKPPSP